MLAATEGSILELLAGHESLGYEQIAAQLGARPDDVRFVLADLRDSGFVDVLRVGDLQRQTAKAASYWRLDRRGAARAGASSLAVRSGTSRQPAEGSLR
jgi:predicted ArsR family transcriptional regulator